MSESRIITLISLEGEKVEIDSKIARRSELIRGILDDSINEIEISLNFVKMRILMKIIDYLKHYDNIEPKEIEKPLKSPNFYECVDEWDYEYINIDTSLIFEIIKASTQMDIKPLTDLASAKVASMIKIDF